MNILRAEAYLNRLGAAEKLSDIYEDDEMLQAALVALLPNFELSGYLHMTVQELRQRYFQAPCQLEAV